MAQQRPSTSPETEKDQSVLPATESAPNNTRRSFILRGLIAAFAVAASLALPGCEKSEAETEEGKRKKEKEFETHKELGMSQYIGIAHDIHEKGKILKDRIKADTGIEATSLSKNDLQRIRDILESATDADQAFAQIWQILPPTIKGLVINRFADPNTPPEGKRTLVQNQHAKTLNFRREIKIPDFRGIIPPNLLQQINKDVEKELKDELGKLEQQEREIPETSLPLGDFSVSLNDGRIEVHVNSNPRFSWEFKDGNNNPHFSIWYWHGENYESTDNGEKYGNEEYEIEFKPTSAPNELELTILVWTTKNDTKVFCGGTNPANTTCRTLLSHTFDPRPPKKSGKTPSALDEEVANLLNSKKLVMRKPN